MSEFQYLEFQSIDKPLSTSDRAAVDKLSSRGNVSANRAIFTYSYSDFRHDVEDVLLNYFDAFLYLSNWGTKRLMLKLPKKLVDYKTIKQYEIEVESDYLNGLTIYKKSKFIIIDISFTEDEAGWWIDEDESWLSDLKGIRSDLLNEDYRSLFIIWLHAIRMKHLYEDIAVDFTIAQKMIPGNLKKLNPSLKTLIDFFEVDMNWINGISKYSKEIKKSSNTHLIPNLLASVKDDYLLRLINGESNLAIKLTKELEHLEPKSGKKTSTKLAQIPLEALLKDVEQVLQKEKGKKKKAYALKMKQRFKNQAKIKDRIQYNILKATSKSYEEAVKEMLELQAAANHLNEEEQFEEYVNSLTNTYSRRSGLIRRLRDKKLVAIKK